MRSSDAMPCSLVLGYSSVGDTLARFVVHSPTGPTTDARQLRGACDLHVRFRIPAPHSEHGQTKAAMILRCWRALERLDPVS